MRRAPIMVAAALAAAVVSTIAMTGTSAGAGPQATSSALAPGAGVFAQLRGTNEVPRADLDGYGSFSAVTPGGNRLCYGYAVANIAKPTQAHIHRGGAGVNGPVVIPLRVPPGSPGTVSGCLTVASTLITQIRANPGAFYVNVHNGPYPGGAIRGQLRGP